MTKTDASELLVRKVTEAVHAVDSAAFLVPSRIVRRVIRAEHDLTGIRMHVPHRKTYVVEANALLALVERDELGVGRSSEVPSPAILIAQPGEERLASMTLAELLRRSWSLLFHARIDATLGERVKAGQLTANVVRERIDRIGQVEFDEMHAVIRQEGFLLTHEDPLHVYIEAAAVFLELKYFKPHWLPAWFPALDDYDRVEAIFATDFDVAALLERTRPEGAPDRNAQPSAAVDPQNHKPAAPPSRVVTSSRQRLTNSAVQFASEGTQNERVFYRFIRRAQKAAANGNSVKAALWRLRAARYGRRENADDASAGAAAEIDHLTHRLQAALGFDDAEATLWRDSLASLLANSLEGFWNADKRVLYDLQKVCVDHEREISKVDLGGWLTSFGRRPFRRLLPNQREVLMSKHLRQATSRLASLRMSGPEREQLSALLHQAAESAEHQLRSRLRPLVSQALDEVGIHPQNLPEQVAREKLIDELLDTVVRHGFVNMSMLRDSLSRNNLKMPDLSGPRELWRGDWLLEADRKLNILLDGVYRRGEIYLRGLQKVSSVAFGTAPGRFVTKFVAIPFGGALILLEGFKHLCDKIAGVDTHAADAAMAAQNAHLMSWFNPQTHPVGFWSGIALVGAFLMGLIHVQPFRRVVVDVLWATWRVLRVAVVDFPLWIWRVSSLRFLIKSRVAKWFREYVLYPLILTLLFWLIFPQIGLYNQPSMVWAVVGFIVLAVALNSRIGRDLEERTSERVHDTWRRVRARVFVAMFEAVMNFFKRLLEAVERVLYAVDEWLRFKSGENSVTLVFKGILGLVWGVVAFVVRFVVNLLVEPQINPIKHFPVVTVSHKIILPLALTTDKTIPSPLGGLLLPLFGDVVTANTVAASVVFLIPGIFGFLVWECKENWRLYAANRAKRLKPVTVGSHGESMIRLMKPGFHSGTVPKIFAKLRRAERHPQPDRRLRNRVKYHEKLNHTIEEVRHFVDRELVRLLAESQEFRRLRVEVGFVQVASNSVRVELLCPELSELSLVLAFQEQSGCLLASLLRPGWTVELDDDQQRTLWLALAGFYKMAGVDVVREQLQSCFERGLPPYDVMDRGLVVWPCGEYDHEVRYDLSQRPYLRPKPRSIAREYEIPTLEASRALYHESQIDWDQWVQAWTAENADEPMPKLFPNDVRLLPQLTCGAR